MAQQREDTGPVYKYQGLEFYAKNGYICVHDDRSHKQGEYTTITASTFRERAMAIGPALRRFEARGQLNPGQREHRDRLKQMVDRMLLCVRDALEQGDLSDPTVAAYHARHQTFRPVRVSMIKGSNGTQRMFVSEVNRPGRLPQGEQTGRIALPDHTLRLAPRKLILPYQ